MIVKIQRAQFPSGNPMAVYNEDRSYFAEIAETRPMLERLRDRARAYFEVELDAAGDLRIIREVPEQPW